ncbi:hypothetical protein GCM10010123_25080 [Pilimelia anulata]|uniref:Uncharacterized protein n=1 Tax=Pilimelia anulata TaxID=53371 RepID=A0A8J3B540_9ACTN|nr:hypothetical protein [Pilimelia anulata]GGJ94209.1 hypothetical protein GCM10010123_25080 [Pilimelia anulata]
MSQSPGETGYVTKLLEIEYAQVRTRIDAIDDIRFKVKGWAITLSSALLALGVNKNQGWIMGLSLLVAAGMCLIEADYLIRQDALLARSDQLEDMMEHIRRRGVDVEVDEYVFGLRAVSLKGVSWRHFPRMFGSRSRAGSTYVLIAIASVIGLILKL